METLLEKLLQNFHATQDSIAPSAATGISHGFSELNEFNPFNSFNPWLIFNTGPHLSVMNTKVEFRNYGKGNTTAAAGYRRDNGCEAARHFSQRVLREK